MRRAGVATQIHFSLARRSDDSDIRRLLRDNAMPGSISLSLEREPDYFADAGLPGEARQTIVAREAGRIVCVGGCTTRLRFVNGRPRRVGYLGGLRLDASVTGRFDILRRGYEFFRELEAAAPADFYFTSIAADNLRGRSFLERGLRGMPRYEFAGEFVTVMLPTERRSPARCGAGDQQKLAGSETGAPMTGELVDLVNEHNAQPQLAPCWSSEAIAALARLGLQHGDVRVQRTADGSVACAALWDQRAFKQTVIRGYAPWLRLARPALNLAARFTNQPRLPAVGAVLAHAFVSHLAGAPNKTDVLAELLNGLCADAAGRGIELLTLGFAANDPRLVLVRRQFCGREYRSRIYLVRWPGIGGGLVELDGRVLAPEVALL